MKNFVKFLIFFLFSSLNVKSQRHHAVPHLINQFVGLSHLEKDGRKYPDFSNLKTKLVPSLGLDVIIKAKKIIHVFSIENSALGSSFTISNKFSTPADPQLGYQGYKHSSSLDFCLFSYSLRKEAKKFNGFVFNTKLKFNYSAGFGFGINRSKQYFADSLIAYESAGFADQYTYIGFESNHYRKGNGLFLNAGGGFDVFSKKSKRILCFNIYYSYGLKTMELSSIHYQYGYYNNPQRQVDVKNVILRLRGTTYGFKVGIPIKII